MGRPYKYITVLDYIKGQVYIYDYDQNKQPSAKNVVASRHVLEDVHYMVHKHWPALWTKDLYFCNREEAYRLSRDEDDNEVYTEHLPPRENNESW